MRFFWPEKKYFQHSIVFPSWWTVLHTYAYICIHMFLFCFFWFFFWFLWLYPWHMEVPWLGAESELQLLASTTATATSDVSLICNLHHSSWKRWILDSLSKAMDWTSNLMVPSQIWFQWARTGTSTHVSLYILEKYLKSYCFH